MARNIRLRGNRPGTQLEDLTIYQNSQTSDNILAQGITLDAWTSGVNVRIADEETTIIAVCMSGTCAGQSSSMSIPPIVNNVRYFNFEVDGGNGVVNVEVPTLTSTSNKVSQTVDFRDHITATAKATPSQDHGFEGWFTSSADTVAIDRNNHLDITRDQYPLTDTFFAKFTDETYQISGSSPAPEGSSITFTINTTGVVDGTSLSYRVVDYVGPDFDSGSVSGSTIVIGNTSNITFITPRDDMSNDDKTVTVHLTDYPNISGSTTLLNA